MQTQQALAAARKQRAAPSSSSPPAPPPAPSVMQSGDGISAPAAVYLNLDPDLGGHACSSSSRGLGCCGGEGADRLAHASPRAESQRIPPGARERERAAAAALGAGLRGDRLSQGGGVIREAWHSDTHASEFASAFDSPATESADFLDMSPGASFQDDQLYAACVCRATRRHT